MSHFHRTISSQNLSTNETSDAGAAKKWDISKAFNPDPQTTGGFHSDKSGPHTSGNPGWGTIGLGIEDDDVWRDAESGFDSLLASPKFSAPRRFFVPLHYETNYRYPLVIWLHNDGFNENQIDQVMPHVSVRNFIAVGLRGTRAVDSIGHRFEWHDSPFGMDVAHERVIEAIEEAVQTYAIHSQRVILAGYRRGGTMALRIAMRDPSRFAAAVSFGGRMPQGGKAYANLDQLRCRRMPMLWQWAMNSASFHVSGLKEDIQSAMNIKARVDVMQYPSDDEMNTAALAEFNQWIMTRVVSGTGTDSAAADRWSTSPTGFSCN